MELRHERGARLRRAARGRAGFVALALLLYLAAGVATTWPAIEHARTHFLAGGAPGHGEAAAGDHLQTGYRLWLVGEQLEHGRAPWRDPYSFRPETGGIVNLAGWPFGLPYWPLVALFGPVLAWNLFVLLTYVGAGGLTCWWLRALRLPRGAALAGGLAYALAPYRAQQSGGHLLGPISLLLPLALLGIERGSLGWLAVSIAALASVPLSGQVHLALGASPFVVAYALARGRLGTALAGALASAGAGLFVREVSIRGSIGAGGRSLGAVRFYSAHWLDLFTRHQRHGAESFVFLGWATPALAALGLAVLLRRRQRRLAVALGLGAVVPILLALGTNLPTYAPLWHALPPFRYPRVPERLMPIAVLCIAALVAFLVARARRALLVPALVVALLFVDLHVGIYRASAADPGNRAYAALRAEAPGRLLELPVFLPDLHYGSVYFYYDMQARRERPSGYSTTAPLAALATARQLQRLNCGDWSGIDLGALGVRYVVLHRGQFERTAVPDRTWFAWRGLELHGFRQLARDGAVTLFAQRADGGLGPPVAEPPRTRPVFCQGWLDPQDGTMRMSDRHAPFWVYGAGALRLRVAGPERLPTRFAVDERPVLARTIFPLREVVLPLGARREWHLVTLDVPYLSLTQPGPTGVRLLSVAVR